MGGYIKKGLWFLLVACILLAVFKGIGSVNNIYPWLTKESNNFQHFIVNLTNKVPTKNLKPMKSILPNIFPSPKATHRS